MGSKRGAANLARFNFERSAHVVPALKVELRLCAKRKLKFKTVGLLAAYLSDRIKVHRTTLCRNVTYNGLLLAHLAGEPGVVSRTADSTSDPVILQAKLAAAKLEASNLREELVRCKGRLEVHTSSPRSTIAGDSGEIAFGNLAMVLVNVLHRYPEFVQLDRGRLELVDLSAKPSARLIAGKERLGHFVRWLEQNQALPMVQDLVLSRSGQSTGGG